MNIITNEIKKIFNPINVGIAIILSIVIWILFIDFYIEYFPNGVQSEYKYSVYMLENYGEIVDKDEFEDFKKMREEKVKEADEYLSSRQEFVNVGLDTYKKFRRESQKGYEDDEKGKLISKVVFEDQEPVFWDIQAIDRMIEDYEVYRNTFIGSEAYEYEPTKVQERYDEIYKSENISSPLHYVITENYVSLIGWVNLLIIITTSIIISPVFTRDKINKVNYIQYTSKEGRGLINKKIVASLISSILIVTINLGIFFIIYKSNNTYIFWNCSINSIFNTGMSWFDITFGEYILISICLAYIIGIAVGIISMYISFKVNTNISLIGIQIPILYLLFWLGRRIVLPYMTMMTSISKPKYVVHITYLFLMIVSVIIISRIIKKSKYLEI